MKYDSQKHHRKSIRLKGYDYSQAGLYFITICTQDRRYLFGEIIKSEGANLCVLPNNENEPQMKLNPAGNMIEKWILELSNKYKNIRCDVYVIMPNHIHLIIEIIAKEVEHAGSPLPEMVKWLKTMTTNEYIRMVKNGQLPSYNKRIWQRNYYEHIIRNINSYSKISKYIQKNPILWKKDKYFK